MSWHTATVPASKTSWERAPSHTIGEANSQGYWTLHCTLNVPVGMDLYGILDVFGTPSNSHGHIQTKNHLEKQNNNTIIKKRGLWSQTRA